jgi:hypothetical protein
MTSTKSTIRKVADKISDAIDSNIKSVRNEKKKQSNTFLKSIYEILMIIKRYIENIWSNIFFYVMTQISKIINIKTLIDIDHVMSTFRYNIGFVMLGSELYCLFFHDYMVRFWIFLNLLSTIYMMYDTLCATNRQDRLIAIGENGIKIYSAFVIGFGVFMLSFFTRNVDLLMIPLILYLINRTMTNIFNRGF